MNVFDRLTLDSVKTHRPRGLTIPRPPHGLETMRKTAPLPLIPVLSSRSGPLARTNRPLSTAVTSLDAARTRNFVPEYASDMELPYECPALPKRKLPVTSVRRTTNDMPRVSRFDEAPSKRDIRSLYRVGVAVKEEERRRRAETAVAIEGGAFRIDELLAPTNPL